jgi:hypothetical protein
VRVDREVALGEALVRLEQFEFGGDSLKLHLHVDPPGPVTVRLAANGRRLEVLEAELDEATGRGRITAYPVLKADAAVAVELKGRGRGTEATLEVPLPD